MDVSFGNYLFVQSALLVFTFAFKPLPPWVVWFPSIVAGIILLTFLIIILVKALVEA